MSEEKKKLWDLPPGFSEDDFIPINIKSVKENEQGFEIEIKPNREKEEGAEYHYKLKNGVFHVLCKGKAVYTPYRTKVTVVNEALAQRTGDHMNIYGEEYESPYSIVNFVYSWLDFFEKETKEELEKPILTDYETDWVFETNGNEFNDWFPNFGVGHEHKEDFLKWLKTLSKFQTGAVIIIGASLSSVNTAYLLSNVWKNDDFEKLALSYFNFWEKSPNKGFFWRANDIAKIFENYLFWQGLGI